MGWHELIATADRAALKHLGGAVVRYAPATGAPVDVEGLFYASYMQAVAGSAAVVSSGPAVFLPAEQLAKLPTDPALDEPTITVAGKSYRVREPQKDSEGAVLLLLTEVG